MNINIKDILTLDDNKTYVVAGKVFYEEKYYYYLIDKNNYQNKLCCYEDKDELVKVKNNKLIIKLLPLFLKSIKEALQIDNFK